MKKLLLTGASGFLGWNICSLVQQEWKIYGIVNTHNLPGENLVVIKTDLTESGAIPRLFKEVQPDGVLHAAAVTNTAICQQNPDKTRKINVDASVKLAKQCAFKNIPCIFTSTDLVFDGKKGNYSEEDEVNPVSMYGEQKAEAERKILETYPEATICRMPLMLGESGPVAKSYLQDATEKLKKGETLNLFTDEYRSVLGGRSAATGLLHFLKGPPGIFHLGGKEKLSRYDLGMIICQVFGFDKKQIIPAKQSDVDLPVPRPPDVTLNSEKAYGVGFDPESLEKELKSG